MHPTELPWPSQTRNKFSPLLVRRLDYCISFTLHLDFLLTFLLFWARVMKSVVLYSNYICKNMFFHLQFLWDMGNEQSINKIDVRYMIEACATHDRLRICICSNCSTYDHIVACHLHPWPTGQTNITFDSKTSVPKDLTFHNTVTSQPISAKWWIYQWKSRE